jgi:dipeptidyl aminopeptidase/acylaminoacyl peptidase
VVSRSDGELEDVVLSGDGRVAALTWNVDGGISALTLLEVPTGRQYAVLPLPRPIIHGCGLSSDGSRLVLCAEGPTDPRGIWTLDVRAALDGDHGSQVGLVPVSSPGRGPLQASVGATADSIDPAAVVRPVLVGLRSADGTPVSGWLYSPGAVGPFPTLIWLHGGPEMQERPVYNSLFQSLLAEGVAVFAPNVRGSTGHGRSFRHADDVAGRYGAFEDVAACAEHLIDIGIAQRGRIGISGRSYGGYLTVAALVRYPDLFAVGVDVSGMSDLHTFYRDTEPWIGAAAVSKYGHPEHDADLLRDLSPLRAVDRIQAPLLIVHGSDDTNVPLGEATQLAAALAERHLPHRLLVFEGEGHELLATENRVEFVRAVVAWVVRHLGDAHAFDPPAILTG